MSSDLLDMLSTLPVELKQNVYRFAGPLTALLHHETEQPLTRIALQLAIADCFEQNRIDLVATLPRDVALSWELLMVHTLDMKVEALSHFTREQPAEQSTGLNLKRTATGRCIAALRSLIDSKLPLAASPSSPLVLIAHRLLQLVHDTVRPSPAFGPNFGQTLLACAAGLGRIDIIRSLLPHVANQLSHKAFDLAGRNNHLNVIRFFCEQHPDAVPSQLDLPSHASLDGALRGGHLPIVQYLRAVFPTLQPSLKAVENALTASLDPAYASAAAARVILWMLTDDPQTQAWPAFATLQKTAARNGHLDLLQFAISNKIGGDFTQTTMLVDQAASGGHLHIIEWLHSQSITSFSGYALDRAAKRGHLTVLQYLYQTGSTSFKPNRNILAAAATHGHFETFKWLWTLTPKSTALVPIALCPAALRGHFWIIEFFAQETRSTQSDLTMLIRDALAGGHLALAQHIHALGRSTLLPAMMESIVINGHLECARWLHQHLWYGFAPELVIQAASNGHADILEFLVDVCGLPVTEDAYEAAHQHRRLSSIKFFFLRDPDCE